jgi:repressor LexA
MAPIAGRVQAGPLTEAIEAAEGFVAVPADEAASCFALRVVGESMAGREIHDGDIVLVRRGGPVRSGDVVVAQIDGEATVKTLQKSGPRIVLKAENPAYSDIVLQPGSSDSIVLGRVYEVRRRL